MPPAVLSLSGLKNSTRLVAGPGSGKSRMLGRLLCWQMLLNGTPLVVLDPTGGVIDNVVDKVIRLPRAVRRLLWRRIVYVDVAATDYVVPTPFYHRLRPDETLFETAARLPAVFRATDPALAGAPILGMNALLESAVYAGQIAAAQGRQVDFALDLLEHPRQHKEALRHALERHPELGPAVQYVREMMDPEQAGLRERRTGSLRTKLLPFRADSTMLATFAAPRRGIDWERIDRQGQAVLVDFRNELDPERRQFKLVWWYRDITGYVKARGTAGRGREIMFVVDELPQLLGPRTPDGRSLLASDLEETISAHARAYGLYVVLAHQNLFQLDDGVRDTLAQPGTQIIGDILHDEDRRHLAEQLLPYDPYWVKKRERVWANVPQIDELGYIQDYSWPEVIDHRDVEFTPEEQLHLAMDRLRQPRFQFLVRPATAEGMIARRLYRVSIEKLDRGQYPDAAAVRDVLALLRQKDGIPIESILAEIRSRRDERAEGRTKQVQSPPPAGILEASFTPTHAPVLTSQPQHTPAAHAAAERAVPREEPDDVAFWR